MQLLFVVFCLSRRVTDGSKNESTEDRRCGVEKKQLFHQTRHSNWMHAGAVGRSCAVWNGKRGEKVAVRGSFVWSRGEIETGGGESVSRRDSIFESSWWGGPVGANDSLNRGAAPLPHSLHCIIYSAAGALIMHRNYTPQKRANSQTTRPESESKFLACTTHYANSSTSNLFLCRACACERSRKADAPARAAIASHLQCNLAFLLADSGVIPNYHSASPASEQKSNCCPTPSELIELASFSVETVKLINTTLETFNS